MSTAAENLTGADAEWGYRFGCDGVLGTAAACDFMSTSRWTLERLVDAGQIRKGKADNGPGGAVKFCRRSLKDYLATLEI